MAYQEVHIGKDQAIDVDSLNKFSLNDQYLQDILIAAPRGIVAWTQVNGNINVAYSADVPQPVAGLELTFTAEEDRFYTFSITYSQGGRTGAIDLWAYFSVLLDGVAVNTYLSGFVDAARSSYDGKCMEFVPREKIAAGTHTVQFASMAAKFGTNYVINGSATSPIQFWVRDLGAWVEAS